MTEQDDRNPEGRGAPGGIHTGHGVFRIGYQNPELALREYHTVHIRRLTDDIPLAFVEVGGSYWPERSEPSRSILAERQLLPCELHLHPLEALPARAPGVGIVVYLTSDWICNPAYSFT